MQMELHYGKTTLEFETTSRGISIFQPNLENAPEIDEDLIVKKSLEQPLNGKYADISPETIIGIGINDQSRPIPHRILLPNLLKFLIDKGAKKENITFYIATGTHTPVNESNFHQILSDEIIGNYKIVTHDCDNKGNFVKIGYTTRNTPVCINKFFYNSDLKIVVGNIESHHFMGFSGGYKTASIGLASRETITGNHALLPNLKAKMGLFSTNSMRQEVEEIGRMIIVDFALNIVINPEKKILACYWGSPEDVILKGIEYIRANIQLDLGEVLNQFDLVIASAGGYPKDINFYQAQKAITHACLFVKPEGKIILAAECRDSFGSDKFEKYITSHKTADDIIRDFESQGFEIGPHKAYQLARQITEFNVTLISSMKKDDVQSLKLTYQADLQSAIDDAIKKLPQEARIAVLPYATHTMPRIRE